MHLYPYSSNVNKTVRKLHKIIQKRLPSIDGPRTPHILLDIVFPIDSMPLAEIDICANESLYERNWLCELFTYIFFFIIILEKNSFWREFWVEGVTALRLKANLEPCKTLMMEPLREKPLPIFTKSFIIDLWLGSKWPSDGDCC